MSIAMTRNDTAHSNSLIFIKFRLASIYNSAKTKRTSVSFVEKEKKKQTKTDANLDKQRNEKKMKILESMMAKLKG